MLGSENPDSKSIVMRIRKTKIFAPFFVFFYCLVINGAWLDGWRGWHYTIQRTLVELLFALRLIEEEKLKGQVADEEDALFRANHYRACSEKHDTTTGEIRV